MDRRQKADGDHPGSGTRSSSGQNPRNRGTLEAERSPTRLGHREQRTKQPRQPAVGAPRGGGANHRRNLRRAIVHLRSPRSDEMGRKAEREGMRESSSIPGHTDWHEGGRVQEREGHLIIYHSYWHTSWMDLFFCSYYFWWFFLSWTCSGLSLLFPRLYRMSCP